MKFSHIARAVHGQPWAILPEKLSQIVAILEYRASGGRLPAEEIEARIAPGRASRHGGPAMAGAVAVIPVYGVISPRANAMQQTSGGTAASDVSQMLAQALADPQVGSVMMDFATPGGNVYGIAELAAEIFAARQVKPCVGMVTAQCASAGYWLASACSEIVVTPSGEVGSIGVYTTHMDQSAALESEGVKPTIISAGKYKVEANPFGPLTAEARAALQASVDNYYAMFVNAVAKGRNASPAAVRGGMGQGRMVAAQDAVQLGMADRVATFDQTIRRMASVNGTQGAARAETMAPDPLDALDQELAAQETDEAIDPDLVGRIALEQARHRLALRRF